MKLGFLASGKGSNIKSIFRAIDDYRLDAYPVILISDNLEPTKFANQHELAFACIHADDYIRNRFQAEDVDYVLCCGYLKKVGPLMLEAFPGRILNIHPSLLPKHGGKGMYGLKVHQAVLDAGDAYTGATVHIVDSEYDRGKILGQMEVPVWGNDTAEILKQKVFQLEEKLYVNVLNSLITLQEIFGFTK